MSVVGIMHKLNQRFRRTKDSGDSGGHQHATNAIKHTIKQTHLLYITFIYQLRNTSYRVLKEPKNL